MGDRLTREQRLLAARLSGVTKRHASGLADTYRARGEYQPEPLDEMRSVTADPAVLADVAAVYLAGGGGESQAMRERAVSWLVELGVDMDTAADLAVKVRRRLDPANQFRGYGAPPTHT
jgi:hypothetical protein